MLILHVSDCYQPRVGGIELHVRDLAERQRAAGHTVVVATRTPGTSYDVEDDVRRVGLGDRAWLGREAPDVVHAHVSVVSPFALAAARRAGRLGIPTVVTVHSLWSHVGPLPELARDLGGMRGWPVVWSAVSERAALPVHACLGLPVHVVANAVDLDAWTPLPAIPEDGTARVLSVMRLTSVKRAMPLVRVLHQVSRSTDLRATIVGDGPQRPAVERYLRRHRLTDRIRLAGVLDRSEIRRHLESASVFVAPAHRESFGIAALEARASGVPILASARSGVATFVEHGRDGLLARDDQELEHHLHALLTDHELRRSIARHNRLVPPVQGWDEALVRNDELYANASRMVASTRASTHASRRMATR